MELLPLVPKGCTSQALLSLHIKEIPPPNDAYPDTTAAQDILQGRFVFPLKKRKP